MKLSLRSVVLMMYFAFSGHTCGLQEGKGEGYVQEERRCTRRLIYVMKINHSVLSTTVRRNVFFHILESEIVSLFSNI